MLSDVVMTVTESANCIFISTTIICVDLHFSDFEIFLIIIIQVHHITGLCKLAILRGGGGGGGGEGSDTSSRSVRDFEIRLISADFS